MLVPALTGYIDKSNEKKIIATARQYYVAAQTVVSEAYANGNEIKEIIVLISDNKIGQFSSIQIGNDLDGTPEDNKYFQSFLNLAELTDDTSYIYVIFSNQTVYSFYVKIGNKLAALSNGKWTVESYGY
ncbi:MAG: hypothetical protein PUD27_07640 [Solobacterium sp.]|nr:hypothetical protein [Solobacterium sp.]